MKGFKQYLLSEIRHATFRTPVKLRISEPVNGHFQTNIKEINALDMKYEFYLDNSVEMMQKKFIQQLPEDVRTKDTQVLICEGAGVGNKFYIAEVDKALLHKALIEKHAYVDIKKKQLVESNQGETIIECEVNPLDRYHIPKEDLYDAQLHMSAVREGWESINVFTWWHFVMCTDATGYAKKSCRYDTYELSKIANAQTVPV